MVDPADLSLRDAVALLEEGELSPLELLESCLARAHEHAELGAFVALDEAGARAEARKRPGGILFGAPVAVKDVIDVAGLPTRAGSRATPARRARRDAALVGALRLHGAVIVGKTTTHELAYGVTTPAVHNPRSPDLSAGGSSAGSAVAVAIGASPLAIGTDTAGSVRIPAICCGVAGLIARPGILPNSGIVPLAPSFDTIGALVREPGDIPLAWRALAGASRDTGRVQRALLSSPESLGKIDPSAHAGLLSFVARLGAPCVDVHLPAFTAWGRARAIAIGAEALGAHRAAGFYPGKAELLGADIRQLHEQAERTNRHSVERAQARIASLAEELRAAIRPGDVLVTPALPEGAPVREVSASRAAAMLTRFLAPINAAGLAAVVLPGGIETGVQLVARNEATLINAVERLSSAGLASVSPVTGGQP